MSLLTKIVLFIANTLFPLFKFSMNTASEDREGEEDAQGGGERRRVGANLQESNGERRNWDRDGRKGVGRGGGNLEK